LWKKILEFLLEEDVNLFYGVILRFDGRPEVVGSTSTTKGNSVIFGSLAVNNQISKIGKGYALN
jgi:hypothetical protein